MVKKYKRKTRRIRHSRRRRRLHGGSEKSAMVILEPRKHEKLQMVLENAHKIMPLNWDLYVFHGENPDTVKAAEAAVASIRQKRNVILKSIGVDNMTATDYNRKFQDKEFWKQVDAENILVFQTDSILCGARPIDEFLKYDYIGCSFYDKHGENSLWGQPYEKHFYGVGGLSFRHKSFMLNCIDKYGKEGVAEDVIFSRCVHESPPERRPESSEVLHRFCTQRNVTEKSFGMHKIVDILPQDKEALFDFCPDARML
jgi:hypothetical protein